MVASSPDDALVVSRPSLADGGPMWALAHRTPELDANTSYAYLLWCRDFALTTAVARAADRLAGFVTGFRRPQAPSVLMVWQVAVDPAFRNQGVAGAMLDELVDRLAPNGIRYVETTITPGNVPSHRLFRGFAARHGATVEESRLFEATLFPDDHEAEDLLRIGPLSAVGGR